MNVINNKRVISQEINVGRESDTRTITSLQYEFFPKRGKNISDSSSPSV